MRLLSSLLDIIGGKDWDSTDTKDSDSGPVSTFSKTIGESKFEIIDRPSNSTGNAFDIKVDGKIVERHADNE